MGEICLLTSDRPALTQRKLVFWRETQINLDTLLTGIYVCKNSLFDQPVGTGQGKGTKLVGIAHSNHDFRCKCAFGIGCFSECGDGPFHFGGVLFFWEKMQAFTPAVNLGSIFRFALYIGLDGLQPNAARDLHHGAGNNAFCRGIHVVALIAQDPPGVTEHLTCAIFLGFVDIERDIPFSKHGTVIFGGVVAQKRFGNF